MRGAARWARVAAILAVPLVLALAASRGWFDAGRAWAALGRFPIHALAPAMALMIAERASQHARFFALLPPAPGRTWATVGRSWALGELVNNLLPARSGDALKVALVGRGGPDGGYARVAGVLVADRLVEAAALALLIAAPGVRWLGEQGAATASRAAPWLAGGVVLVGATALALRRKALLRQLLDGIAVLRRPRPVAAAFALSLAVWACDALSLRELAGGAGCPLGFAPALAAVVVLNLAIVVPISVGNVGTYEAALAFGLGAVGVPAEEALVVALLHHVLQVGALATWAGLLFVTRRGGADSRPDRLDQP